VAIDWKGWSFLPWTKVQGQRGYPHRDGVRSRGSEVSLMARRGAPPGPQTPGVPPNSSTNQEVTVKRALAAIVGVAFVFASAGLVGAQTSTPATKTDDKKMEDKSSMKKAPHHTAVGTVKTAAPDSIVVGGKSKGKDTEWTFALD